MLDIVQEITEGWHDKISPERMEELWQESNDAMNFFELVSDECLDIKKKYKAIEAKAKRNKITEWDAIHAFKVDNFLYNHCLYKIDQGEEVYKYKDLLRKLEEKRIDKTAVKNKDIISVISSFGIPVNRNKIKCPFHEDKTESLHLYTRSNSYYCFGCTRGGDIIQFVMDYKQCNFKEACNLLINFI